MRGSVTGLTSGSHKPGLRVQVPSAQHISLEDLPKQIRSLT